MVILHIYKNCSMFSRGGVQSVIDNLVAGDLDDVHHEIAVVQPVPRYQKFCLRGVSIHCFPQSFCIGNTSFSFSAFLFFLKRARGYDIAHLHYPYPAGDLLYLLSLGRLPLVVTYHSDIVRQKWLKLLYWPIEQLMLRRAAAILATSMNYVASSKKLRAFKYKVKVIPLGLDDQFYSEKSQVELEFKNYFLFVGAPRSYKGLHVLYKAFNSLSEKLVIIGDFTEGDAAKYEFGLRALPNVKIFDRASDEQKRWFLANCRALILPSNQRSEAYGLAILEGMMFSKPVITTELGTGTSYLVVNNETGFVIGPDNVDDLCEKVMSLSGDAELAKKLGINGRARYLALFQAHLMRNRYYEVWKHL